METDVSSDLTDRRRSRRRHSGHGVVSARIRPGYEVSVIDVSAGGALIEGSIRLLPGSMVELQLRGERQRTAFLRARVDRSSVACVLADVIHYRDAIVFEGSLSWFNERDSGGYSVPISEDGAESVSWAKATHANR